MTDQSSELTLGDAKKLYAKFADKEGGDAVRVMAQIASWGKRQQVEGGRLRLLALRQLGRFLIRHGRGRGRPAKMSDTHNLPTLVDLGITDRHISADAKSVARISQPDFDAYLTEEDEPTLTGLLWFGEHTRSGRPYPVPSFNTHAVPLAMQGKRSWLDPDETTSTVEWYTPPEIFEAMEAEFDLDVASPGANIVPWIPAKRHLTKKDNGLVADWSDAFCWMNPPYGLRNGIAEWIDKFVQHGNGVAIAPDFTSTEWWHALTERADIIMFVRPKIYFLPKREDGRTNSLGSTLVAIGERGVQALRNAERNGRGLCFQRDARAVRLRLVEAAD
jgi:DNA N-6-adenine-methyltransferase (Dam)